MYHQVHAPVAHGQSHHCYSTPLSEEQWLHAITTNPMRLGKYNKIEQLKSLTLSVARKSISGYLFNNNLIALIAWGRVTKRIKAVRPICFTRVNFMSRCDRDCVAYRVSGIDINICNHFFNDNFNQTQMTICASIEKSIAVSCRYAYIVR